MSLIDKQCSANSSNNNSNNNSDLTKLKNFLDYVWPIERNELSKFLVITLLMFCILGIQNLTRALKDSIINTMIGAETISFLKFWGVMPAAFLITIVYVKLVNTIKGEYIFYLITLIFLIFFGFFAFSLFPNHEMWHLNTATVNTLIQAYPNLKWFILLLSKWSFSLFYIMAELWPSAIFALLFWQFVNMITTVEESKRFYPLFGLLGQTGLYLSGEFLHNLGSLNNYLATKFNLQTNTEALSIQIVLSTVLLLGVIALLAFWMLNHKILDAANLENLQFKIKKHHMNFMDSFKMIISSKHIMLIASLLICYGIAINLVEGPWKSAASNVYKNPTEYSAFVGSYLRYTGLLTILFVLLGSNIVRRLGWFAAAIITPLMVLITGILFFLISNFDVVSTLMICTFAITDPALIAVTIGAIQNVLSKASKYTLFDSTKEMSYVPLDHEIKTKGKAAVDMIALKLGKSMSALLQLSIFIIIPTATYHSISIYLMVIFSVICIAWIWSVIELNKEYKKAVLAKIE